jgi:hypothetical protein
MIMTVISRTERTANSAAPKAAIPLIKVPVPAPSIFFNRERIIGSCDRYLASLFNLRANYENYQFSGTYRAAAAEQRNIVLQNATFRSQIAKIIASSTFQNANDPNAIACKIAKFGQFPKIGTAFASAWTNVQSE